MPIIGCAVFFLVFGTLFFCAEKMNVGRKKYLCVLKKVIVTWIQRIYYRNMCQLRW